MLKAGNMIHRVKVLAPPTEVDEMLQPVDNWPAVGERWAEVRDLTGRRLTAAQQVHGEVTTEVRMHYTDKVKPGYRLQLGQRVLEIIGAPADPTGLRREIVCTCREVV